MRVKLFAATAAVLCMVATGGGLAAASDDPVICGPAQVEWRALDKKSRPGLEKFIQALPGECQELRREAQQLLEALPPPPSAGPPSLGNDVFSAELDHCRLVRGGAECTLFVEGKKRVNWIFSNRTYLVDEHGGRIHVAEMTIGNITKATKERPNHYLESDGVYLEPGIRTRIIYRFSGEVDPAQTQALIIVYPRNSSGSLADAPAILKPIPWR